MTQPAHPLVTLFGEDFAQKSRQCISCNLCKQFCPVFPQLFTLLRQDARGSEPVDPTAYAEILDACWLCGRCELRCPGNLEFSQQVIRARLSNTNSVRPEDRILSRPQELGRWGSRLAPLANAIISSKLLRRWSERFTGIDHRAEPPRFQWPTFQRWFARRRKSPSTPRQRVAYFVGCHANYYRRSVGEAAVTVLERNGVEVVCPEFRCCGMPQLAAGDGAQAEANARYNVEQFSRLVEAGYEIVSTCSTCTLALKYHYPTFWPSAASEKLAKHTWDIFSYLRGLRDTRALDLDLQPLERSVRYHYPCHARSQRYGNNVIDLLRLIPKLKVDYAAMACCGMGGTHGFKRRHYETSQAQGADTFAFLDRVSPDTVVTDCPMCAHRIGARSGLETIHPIELLNEAHGY